MKFSASFNRKHVQPLLRSLRRNYVWVIVFFLCAVVTGLYLSLQMEKMFHRNSVEIYQIKVIKLEKQLAEAKRSIDLTPDESIVPNPVHLEIRKYQRISVPTASYRIDKPTIVKKKKKKKRVTKVEPLLFAETIGPKPLSRRVRYHESHSTPRHKAIKPRTDQSSSPVYRIQIEAPTEWRSEFEPLRIPICETDRADANVSPESDVPSSAYQSRTD